MHFNAQDWKLLKDCFIDSSADTKRPDQLQSTFDENQFQKDLGEARQRTSSPINFRSFIQNSLHMDVAELQDRHSDPLPDLKG